MQAKRQQGVLDVPEPPQVKPLPQGKPAPVGEQKGQILKATQESLQSFDSKQPLLPKPKVVEILPTLSESQSTYTSDTASAEESSYFIYAWNRRAYSQDLVSGRIIELGDANLIRQRMVFKVRDIYEIQQSPLIGPSTDNYGFYHGIWSDDYSKFAYIELEPGGAGYRINLYTDGKTKLIHKDVLNTERGYLDPLIWGGPNNLFLIERYELNVLTNVNLWEIDLITGKINLANKKQFAYLEGNSYVSPDSNKVFIGTDIIREIGYWYVRSSGKIEQFPIKATAPIQNTSLNGDETEVSRPHFYGIGILSKVFNQQLLNDSTSGPKTVSNKDQRPSPFLYWPLPGDKRSVLNYADSPWRTALANTGLQTYTGHQGTDVMQGGSGWQLTGIPIYAAAEGTVVNLFNGCPNHTATYSTPTAAPKNCEIRDYPFDSGWGFHHAGNAILMSHTITIAGQNHTWYSFYAHLKKDSLLFNIGGIVHRGNKIAEMGHSGVSTHPHLHFEIRNGNDYRFWDDPWGSADAPHTNPDDATLWVYQNGVIALASSSGGGGDTTDPTGGFDSPAENATITSGSVNISGWGSDSGSGFDHAHFTAAWSGRDWHVISQDFTSSPFNFNWDMCGEGVPNNTQISIGLDIWDKAGNDANSPGGVRHIYKNHTCNANSAGNWKADYYDTTDRWNDNNNNGNFRCSETINGPTLDRNYGTGAACSMDGDYWVGDYSAIISFSAGNYVFLSDHDDGMKIWLDNNNIGDYGGSGSNNTCQPRYLSAGNHTLRVMLREDGGDARVKLTWTTDSSVCNRSPANPTLSSPGDYSEHTTSAPNLCWNTTSDPEGDSIQYYAEVFDSAVNANSGWISSTCWRPSSLDGQYYNYQWRVRARDSHNAESDWSNTRHFTIKQASSGVPSLVSPANQTTVGRYDNVVLQWNTASNATQYYGEFWGGPNFSVDSTWISGTSWTVGSTFWGGKFQWRVRSRNSAGVTSDWSETRWLYRRYGAPGSLSSSNIGQNTVTLNWSASADAPGNIDGYRIYRDGSPINTVGSSTITYTDSGISCGETHTYVVRAYNDDLESLSSNSINVSTQTCPPADTTPPTVSWISPATNQQTAHCTSGTVLLRAAASDNVGIASLLFHWYNQEASEWQDIVRDYTAPYEVTVNCLSFNLGWNQINASPEDTAGNNASEYIWLYRDPPKPDLMPYQPYDRPYPLTPSAVSGTYTTSDILFSNHPTYLDWLFINVGNAPATTFKTQIWVDDDLYVDYQFVGLDNGYMYVFDDWVETIPTPGWHTLRMVVDAENTVDELDESNNVFEHDFYFTAYAPYANDFEAQAVEWEADGLWNLFNTAHTGSPMSWLFNNLSPWGYDVGHAEGNLTSPPIYIPTTGYYLRFVYGYETETMGPDFDQRWVQISVDGGDFVNLYQLYDDRMNNFQMGPTIDLSAYANHTVRIRFRFDSIDSIDNDHLGWIIDDFSISDIDPVACPDTHEPNNAAAQATGLSIDGQVDGAICPNGDYDYYTFNGQTGDVIVADIDTDGASSLDPILTLYSANGHTVMAENDDDGYTTDSKLSYVLPNSGVYYLKVRSYGHPGAGNDTSTYTLNLYTDTVDPDWAEFLSPASGDWLDPNSVTMEVDASDGQSGISRVEFLWHSADWENDDWEWLGSDRFGWDGFSYTFNTSVLDEQHGGAFYAWAFDYSNKYASAGVWDLGIDRTAPETAIGVAKPYGGADFTYFYLYWDGTDNLSGVASFDVQVRDNSGGDWTDLVTGTTNTWWHYSGLQDHTYAFRMRAVDYAGNVRDYPAEPELSYTTTVCAISADSAETNNTYTAARPFTPGNTLNLNFHAAYDEDWFYLDTTAGRQFVLQTANTGGYSDTVLYLYDSDGHTLLDSNDDAENLNFASRLVWTAPQNGRYYLQVVHWNGDAYGCQTAYTLSITDITPNPLPEISSINPVSGMVGSGAITLQVMGSNFVSNSIVRLNSANLATTYVSSAQLNATIPASTFATASTAEVTVFNPEPGGGLSASRVFTILNPVPTISNLSPSTVEVGSGALNLTVTGTNFVGTSVVHWNGTALATTYNSATQLRAAVPANLLATTGAASVTVFNPTPGGGASGAASFAINNPTPVLNSINPTSGLVYGTGFTLNATGSKFINGSVIQWNGENLATTFVSSTSLTAAIPADRLASAGTVKVRVVNPAPGGGASAERDFTVSNPYPNLTSINPTSVLAGGASFTLTVNGSNFVSTSRILWNGAELDTSFVNASQLTAIVPAVNTANKSTASVSVRSPAPGGGASGAQSFTIQADGKCIASPVLVCGGSDTRRNDATGSTNRVDSYSCAPSWNESGPEITYRFTPPADYNVTVGLSGLSVDLDLFVLNDSSGECRGSNCLAAHEDTARFTAQSGQTYYLVVDGANGATGSYNISVNCSVNPVPAISSLSPASALVNGPTFSLTINGNNFIDGSVVRWNGTDLVTTYNSSTRLTATVPAANLASTGTVSVTVFNPTPGGGLSGVQTFTITYPVPSLSSISPSSAEAGSGAFILTLTGSGFVNNSVARWNGEELVTTFTSSTTLSAQIPAERIALGGTASITVFTPTPGGGTTTSRTFTINNPLPTLSSINPSQALTGDSGFTLDLTGSKFVAGSVVRWNGVALTTSFLNPTHLQATVPTANLASAGAFPVTVFNPTPGGGASNSLAFAVNNPVPALISINPTSAQAYGSAFTLTVTGSSFISSTKVRWNSTDLTTTFVSSTQITASVPASLLLSGGTVKISARTPPPGGGFSTEMDFTINNPLPSISSLSPSSRLAGSSAFIITVNGDNFVSGSRVVWNDTELNTTFVSKTQLSANVTANLILTAGTVNIVVRNPEPGGGDSSASQFSITIPSPTLTSINPTSAEAGSDDFALTLTGSGFVNSSVARWNGENLVTTYTSSTTLTAQIPAERVALAGTANLTVFNPAPGGGTTTSRVFTINNPLPTLSAIFPTEALVGDNGFTLELTGSRFVTGSVVRWNGVALTTTYISSTQLQANIPASSLTSAGTLPVTVFNPTPGGGASSSQTFSVANPVPVLTAIEPTSADAYSSALTLTVTGSSFVNSTRVRWNGTDLVTTFVSDTRLTAGVPANLLLSGGSAHVSTFTPAPGGGLSGELTFIINNPQPVISVLSPSSRLAGSSAFTLTVTGSGFVNGSTILWNGADLPTIFTSRTQISASVPASLVASAGTATILVHSPQPGGGDSNTAQFPITNPSPSLTDISPTSVMVESAGFTLTLNGSNFLPVSVVRWNNEDLLPNNITGTLLTLEVPAKLLENAGYIQVSVFNPQPGGGTSLARTLSITNPIPVLESINPRKIKAGTIETGKFLDLVLTGSRFSRSAIVYWNGTSLTTTRTAPTELIANVPANLVANPGIASIQVYQPSPGGGTTQNMQFTIQPSSGIDCTAALTLDSAYVDSRRNDGPGSTDLINGYGITPWVEHGPEFIYALTPAISGRVGLYLSGMSTNMDLFLLDGELGVCNSSEVLTFGDKEIIFDAEAGHPYYIVVDGRSGAKGKYTLSVDNDNRAPTNGTQLVNNRPLFNWEDTPGATSYLLQISAYDTFSRILTTRTSVKSISQTMADLPKDRYLYWRVIPKFGARLGTKSPIWSMQTANPPGTPVLVGPSTGALLHTLHPRLDWRNVTVPAYKVFGYYQVQVSSDASFLAIVANEQAGGSVENSEVTLATELQSNMRYYWRVRAFTSDGHYSNWSGVRSFRTALLPPVLSQPGNGGSISTVTPSFSWMPVPGAASYTMQVSLSPVFSTTTISKTLSATLYTPTTVLRADRTYYWRVRANGSNGPSKWSEVWSFTTLP